LGDEKAWTLAVVLAVAIGVGAFSTVLSTYAVLLRELNEGYLATNPASATIQTDRVDGALLTRIRAMSDVAQAEARGALSGQIKAGPAEWKNLLLFVIDDYQGIEVSRVVPQSGGWPPAAGEILLERDALQVAKARVGDEVAIKTARGGEARLKVAGSVHDVGQAQARMENRVYGYITLDTLARLGEEPFLDRLLIVASGPALDESRVRFVAEEVRAAVAAQGHPIVRLDVPRPGKHPHADLMGLLLLALAAFGLLAVLLAGFVVANLLTAVVASQVRQVGVMKAIGGTSARVASLYLGEALLLGAGGLALGIPAGAWGGRLLTRTLAVLLNFDIHRFAVPAWVYALDAVVGLLVPCLAAAYPVFKAARMSVREALADRGTRREAFETTALDRALGRTRVGPFSLLILRSALRRRARTALTVATFGVAGLFFMSALNVRSSLIRTLDGLFAQSRYDLSLTLGTMSPVEAVAAAANGVPGVARVEGWVTTEASLGPAVATGDGGAAPGAPADPRALHGAAPGGEGGERVTVLGVPGDTTVWRPAMLAGRPLGSGDRGAVVVNSAFAARSGRGVGQKADLQMGPHGVSLPIVGVSFEPFAPAVVYAPLAFFADHGHAGMTNSLRVALDARGGRTVSQVREELDRRLEAGGIRAVAGASTEDRRYGFDQHMLMIYVFLVVTSAILGAVGVLSLLTTLTLGVLERRRELGVLRALGASPARVALLVAAEGVFLSLISWALAIVLAWPVSEVLGNALVAAMFRTHLTFGFDPRGPLVWLLVSLVAGLTGSALPAWRGAKAPVRESIGYE
jgi:putative ABC transport system permease protein